ncbi:MAG TPA: LacI family DNA-binding transcriptional regulator [Amycolatopsis sp.]|nr:LacI family DNA-binding transcriptional regulator [Amycolatopsis sp.]
MRVTIAEIARRARVSKTTVSRVLNNKTDVDAATAVRVREVIAATGYIPSAGAVGLARGRSRLVGVLASGLSHPDTAELLQAIADVADEHDHGLLLGTAGATGAEGATGTADTTEAALDRFANRVRARAFDGLVLLAPPPAVTNLEVLRDPDLPVVIADGTHPALPSVSADDPAGAAAVARHFLSRGRRRIAVVTGPGDRWARRFAGFRAALAETGLPLGEPTVAETDLTARGGRDAAHRLLASGREFDAVFAPDDTVAAAVAAVLRETGHAVPAMVAVAGFGDTPLAVATDLTTVRRPLRALGQTAARRLFDRLTGSPPGETTVLPTELVVRGSAP